VLAAVSQLDLDSAFHVVTIALLTALLSWVRSRQARIGEGAALLAERQAEIDRLTRRVEQLVALLDREGIAHAETGADARDSGDRGGADRD
jgi:hypothetical protein